MKNTKTTAATPKHTHQWKYYDGALGYESHKCRVCDVDAQDLIAKITLADLDRLACHDELVAALERCEAMLSATECTGDKQLGYGQVLDQARTALAKAGKARGE